MTTGSAVYAAEGAGSETEHRHYLRSRPSMSGNPRSVAAPQLDRRAQTGTVAPEVMTPVVLDEGTSTGPTGPQVCPICNKKFGRLCDLNKHSKTHSRPFKCPEPSCQYHKLGWPTAKELERHQDDKHSGNPGQFTCAYVGCEYRSKRESNCKQHMEKTHGWTYVRSKPGGRSKKARDAVGSRQLDALVVPPAPGGLWLENSPATAVATPHSVASGFFVDFGGAEDAAAVLQGMHDHEVQVHAHHGPSGALDPWISPQTPHAQGTPLFPQSFTSTFCSTNGVPAGPPSLLVDPQICQPSTTAVFGPLLTPNSPAAGSVAFANPHSRLQSEFSPLERMPVHGRTDSGSHMPKVEQTTPLIRQFEDHEQTEIRAGDGQAVEPISYEMANSYGGNSGQAGQSAAMGLDRISASGGELKRQRDDEADEDGDDDNDDDDDDDDDGGDGPPRKRAKRAEAPEVAEDAMPCIFRFARPDLYPSDPEESKSPCYTQHKDISQLVRHLGRAAHRLTVNTRSVSSFDIADASYPHPPAGLCRVCWMSFRDRALFDDHLRRNCPKVSKGKMEKFWRLHETFCGPARPSLLVPKVRSEISSRRGTPAVSATPTSRPASAAHSRNVSSSGGPEPLTSSDAVAGDALVRSKDLVVLKDRLEAVEKQCHRLGRALKAIWPVFQQHQQQHQQQQQQQQQQHHHHHQQQQGSGMVATQMRLSTAAGIPTPQPLSETSIASPLALAPRDATALSVAARLAATALQPHATGVPAVDPQQAHRPRHVGGEETWEAVHPTAPTEGARTASRPKTPQEAAHGEGDDDPDAPDSHYAVFSSHTTTATAAVAIPPARRDEAVALPRHAPPQRTFSSGEAAAGVHSLAAAWDPHYLALPREAGAVAAAAEAAASGFQDMLDYHSPRMDDMWFGMTVATSPPPPPSQPSSSQAQSQSQREL